MLFPLLVANVANSHAQAVTPIRGPTVLWEKETNGYAIFKILTLATDRDRKVLLAIAEGRIGSAADTAATHVVMRRSNDLGRTWSDTSVIHSDGKRTVGNPVPVLDRDTGTLWLFFCKDNREVWLTSTTDGGLTWKKAVNLSSSLKRPDQTGFYATGPGHGIQLERGASTEQREDRVNIFLPAHPRSKGVHTPFAASTVFIN